MLCASSSISPHSLHSCCRDLKPANLLLDSGLSSADCEPAQLTLKVADLGLARILDHDELSTSWVGSPYYMAPEALAHSPYGQPVDSFAVGCILFQMLFNRTLIDMGHPQNRAEIVAAMNIAAQKYRTASSFQDFLQTADEQEQAGRLPDGCRQLLEGLLAAAPGDRLSLQQLVCHPAIDIAGVEEQKLEAEQKLVQQQFVLVREQARNDLLSQDCNRHLFAAKRQLEEHAAVLRDKQAHAEAAEAKAAGAEAKAAGAEAKAAESEARAAAAELVITQIEGELQALKRAVVDEAVAGAGSIAQLKGLLQADDLRHSCEIANPNPNFPSFLPDVLSDDAITQLERIARQREVAITQLARVEKQRDDAITQLARVEKQRDDAIAQHVLDNACWAKIQEMREMQEKKAAERKKAEEELQKSYQQLCTKMDAQTLRMEKLSETAGAAEGMAAASKNNFEVVVMERDEAVAQLVAMEAASGTKLEQLQAQRDEALKQASKADQVADAVQQSCQAKLVQMRQSAAEETAALKRRCNEEAECHARSLAETEELLTQLIEGSVTHCQEAEATLKQTMIRQLVKPSFSVGDEMVFIKHSADLNNFWFEAVCSGDAKYYLHQDCAELPDAHQRVIVGKSLAFEKCIGRDDVIVYLSFEQ